jgi:hypothetical protein
VSAIGNISTARVIEGVNTVYTALPGGRTKDGERLWWVPCVTCQSQYSVRPRTLREMTASGRDPICALCRRGVKFQMNKWHLRYWLHRYTLEELLEIAQEAYGDVHMWSKRSAGPRERRMALEVLEDFPYQAREAGLIPSVAA